ncbi:MULTISPECIES: substrate-binding domain-containing protein [unclassified Aureimonas]|uniref:substrate-binding domain-containing protein n=1 Tax=unclassified Aureimonas TaxID=2615206 RepID=UPI0006F718C8|nr:MULTISPECIES: substrate-binding domain-containing protein [unclassified Aureimonas]KQT52444.1 hypothetical protein ASG62_14555 [Aureimonas sp. Leaf427]KQT77655.1 hypothetical protein ASG54_11855 [Aureimonas sp. Leaf460]
MSRRIFQRRNAVYAAGLSIFAASTALAPRAAEAGVACPADASVLSARIPSSDLDSRFGVLSPSSKPLKFAYVTQFLDDPFWSEVMAGLRSEAGRLGVSVESTAPKDRISESEQLAVAEAALATNPDVLLLTPINATNLRSVIDKANARGIPTISINLKPEGVRTHIGTDHVALGAKAAEFLHEQFPGGALVAQIEGELTSPYRIDRVKGFKTGLQAYPNLTLVASRTADWARETAMAATLQIMADQPGIRGIYANSDLMALGVVDALAKLDRLDDVVVVGTDGVLPAKEAIAKGTLEGTTAQFPPKEGALAIQTGLRLLACQPVPGWVVSPQSVMTAKSLPDYATN